MELKQVESMELWYSLLDFISPGLISWIKSYRIHRWICEGYEILLTHLWFSRSLPCTFLWLKSYSKQQERLHSVQWYFQSGFHTTCIRISWVSHKTTRDLKWPKQSQARIRRLKTIYFLTLNYIRKLWLSELYSTGIGPVA